VKHILKPEVRGWRLGARFLGVGLGLFTLGLILGLVTTGGGL